jgi:hypothetical protein
MNSRKIIKKLLSKTQNPSQLIGGILGTFLGILLIALAVQIYFEYLHLTKDSKEEFGKQFVIINKKISALNSIGGSVSEFTRKDINQIKKLPSVENIGFFKANKFNVWAEFTFADYRPGLKTELFFEGIDDSFIDNIPDEWGWREGQQMVPMILPADFINLYNFTFAPGRGLPLLSPNTIKLARFTLELSGPGGSRKYVGRIVGYSQRLNSILVPKNFLEFTNGELSPNADDEKVGRIMVEVNQSKASDLYKLIKEKNWETNDSKMLTNKFAMFLELVLLAVVLLGVLILILALFSTVLYVMLSINKAKYEIQTLLLLGIPRRFIVQWYSLNILKIYALIILISLSIVWLLKNSVNSYIASFDFELMDGIHPITIISVFISVALMWFFQFLRIKKLR